MTNLKPVQSFCDLRCFGAISVLKRFSHFCVVQNEIKILVSGAKQGMEMTMDNNDTNANSFDSDHSGLPNKLRIFQWYNMM